VVVVVVNITAFVNAGFFIRKFLENEWFENNFRNLEEKI